MTLSPASVTDDWDVAVSTPRSRECSSILGVFEHRSEAIRAYAREQGFPVVSGSLTVVVNQNTIVVFKAAVFEVLFTEGVATCKTIHVRHAVAVSMESEARGVARMMSDRNKYATCTVLVTGPVTVGCERIRTAHTPMTGSVRRTALACTDMNCRLFYYSLEPGIHVAVIQDTITGKYGCIHPCCRRLFASLKEWRAHYKHPLPLVSRWMCARVVDDLVVQTKDRFYPYIQESLPPWKHPLTHRSLADPAAKDRMCQDVALKLRQHARVPTRTHGV